MLLTQYLLDILHKSGGRIINVASRAHIRKDILPSTIAKWNASDFSFKNGYFFLNMYAYSKLGNVFVLEIFRRVY